MGHWLWGALPPLHLQLLGDGSSGLVAPSMSRAFLAKPGKLCWYSPLGSSCGWAVCLLCVQSCRMQTQPILPRECSPWDSDSVTKIIRN